MDQNVFSQYYDLLLNVARSPRDEFKIQSVQHLTLAMFYGYSHMLHNVSVTAKVLRDKKKSTISLLMCSANIIKLHAI